jgi:hypothetical protein
MIEQLLENAKDLKIYKKLIKILGEYTLNIPATGVNKILDEILSEGIKVIPKDKKALEILNYILNQEKSTAAIVQDLLNTRLCTLPLEVRPMINKTITAFWNIGDKLEDKVIGLLNFKGDDKGFWSDEKRNKVELINIPIEEN